MDINVFAAPLSRVKSTDGNALEKSRGKEKAFLWMPLAERAVLFGIFYHGSGQSEQPFNSQDDRHSLAHEDISEPPNAPCTNHDHVTIPLNWSPWKCPALVTVSSAWRKGM